MQIEVCLIVIVVCAPLPIFQILSLLRYLEFLLLLLSVRLSMSAPYILYIQLALLPRSNLSRKAETRRWNGCRTNRKETECSSRLSTCQQTVVGRKFSVSISYQKRPRIEKKLGNFLKNCSMKGFELNC